MNRPSASLLTLAGLAVICAAVGLRHGCGDRADGGIIQQYPPVWALASGGAVTQAYWQTLPDGSNTIIVYRFTAGSTNDESFLGTNHALPRFGGVAFMTNFVSLSGDTNFVQVGPSTTMCNGYSNLTISLWMNLRGYKASAGILCTRGAQYQLLDTEATMKVASYASGHLRIDSGNNAYTTNVWVNLTWVYIGYPVGLNSYAAFYTNGMMSVSASNLGGGVTIKVDDFWKLGTDDYDLTARGINAWFDDLVMWRSSLTPSQVQSNFNMGRSQ